MALSDYCAAKGCRDMKSRGTLCLFHHNLGVGKAPKVKQITCARCGLVFPYDYRNPGRTTCRDCTDVLNDVELELWAA